MRFKSNGTVSADGAATIVLPSYRQPQSRLRTLLRKGLFFAGLILVGLIYGFFLATFPYWFYQFLAAPLLLLVLLVIWALPDRPAVSSFRRIEWLYWAFLISLLVWPNYLAIAIPGLPWITVQRLFLGPLVFLLLVGLSTNAELRRSIKQALADNRLMTTLMIVFVVVQVITLFFAEHVGSAGNRFVNNQLSWTAVFFVSVWLFQREGRVDKWYNYVLALAVAACLIALFELYLKRVPWAGHIPSFLAVNDERVQNILYGDRARAWTDKYRVAGTFVHPLNLAEFLGLSTAIFVHRMMTAAKMMHRYLAGAALPLLLFVIVATDSRLGSVAFFGSIIGYGFFWGWRRWQRIRGDIIAPALVLSYPIGVAGFLVLSVVWNRLNNMMWGGGNGAAIASTQARQEQWALFWPKFEAWPFGYGTSESGAVLGWFAPDGKMSVDSYFITILLDFGLLGFLAFFGMLLLGTVQAALYSVRERSEHGAQFIPIAVMLPMFILIKSVLSQQEEHSLIFMLLGMVVALVHRQKAAERSRGVVVRPGDWFAGREARAVRGRPMVA